MFSGGMEIEYWLKMGQVIILLLPTQNFPKN